MNENAENFLAKETDLNNAIKVANYVISNNQTHLYEMCKIFKSYHKLNAYSKVFYFENFYMISFFNKLFIFEGSTELEILKNIFSNSKEWNVFLNKNSVALIIDNNIVDDQDFQNLKKCHMLNQKIKYKDGKIYCKFLPYYLVELELFGDILNITVKANNIQYVIEISKIGDIKEYIIENFTENFSKLDDSILNYYARNY